MPLVDAFKLALDSEKRAEDYYAAALQQALEPTVAELFEDLRLAEVEHQRMLKLELSKRKA
jgi:rubrerythrin